MRKTTTFLTIHQPLRSMPLFFVTGNKHKFEEVKHYLSGIDIHQKSFDITEIQGSPMEIAKEKAKQAAKLTNAPVIVDDTSLQLTAWKGMPGPYIVHFMKAIGPEGLYKMLSPFADKSAEVVCVVAYCEPKKEPILFEGRVKGTITSPVPGRFDFDTIFTPDGCSLPFSKMPVEEKNTISHRAKALNKLKKFLLGSKQ